MLQWGYILLLCAGVGAGVFTAVPAPNDDFGLYQAFAEALARGKLDLTIPGFHGSDLFAVPVIWLTGSPVAQIYAMSILATLLPLVAFFAARAFWQPKSTTPAVPIMATIVALMPFVTTVGLRGWTGPGYWTLMLLTVWFAARGWRATGIVWALAILTKPFAIILLPLILTIWPGTVKGTRIQRMKATVRNLLRGKNMTMRDARLTAVMIATVIVLAYFFIQYAQAGRIFIGAHVDTTPGEAIQGFKRIGLNLAHSLQILFSVHNYYYPDPALTGPGNMMHTSPVLIFLGLFGLLAMKDYHPDLRVARALLWGAIAGIVMNALLDHMDHFYMEASILLLLLSVRPVLTRHPFWIPIALATLHFQFFYFWMQYQPGFLLTPFFFAPLIVADVAWLLWFVSGKPWMSQPRRS